MDFTRNGYGQVEFNHMSGPRDGRVYASLPAASTITQLENGQFAKYDYANGAVNYTGDGEWMLVYNEVKLYEPYYRESYKDFVWKRAATDSDGNVTYLGTGNIHLTPRLIGTVVGDLYTTNCFAAGTATITVGDYFTPNSTGYLAKQASKPASGMVWKAVKCYTMPDGQPGVKLQRIQ